MWPSLLMSLPLLRKLGEHVGWSLTLQRACSHSMKVIASVKESECSYTRASMLCHIMSLITHLGGISLPSGVMIGDFSICSPQK